MTRRLRRTTATGNPTTTATTTVTATTSATATGNPTAIPTDRSPARTLLLLGLLALALAGCRRAELLHALDERQANQVLLALDEGGLKADKRRDEGTEAGWVVDVDAGDAARARRLLAERELPRPDPGSLAGAYGKGSLVPTPAEERARFLHATAGELSRSVESIDGVAEARVHLALPPDDPLRGAPAVPPRAAVLVKVRPGARDRVEPLAPGIRSLVAGSVAGLEPAQVSVVVAEGASTPAAPPPQRPLRVPFLALGLGASALSFMILFRALGVRAPAIPWERLRRRLA